MLLGPVSSTDSALPMSTSKQEVGIDPWIIHAAPASAASQYGLAHSYTFSAPDATSEVLAPEAVWVALNSCQSKDVLTSARVDGFVLPTQEDRASTDIGSNEVFTSPSSFESSLTLRNEGTASSTFTTLPAPLALHRPHASNSLAPESCTGLTDGVLSTGDFGRLFGRQAQTLPSPRPVQTSSADSLEVSPSQNLHSAGLTGSNCLAAVERKTAGVGAIITLPKGKERLKSGGESMSRVRMRYVTDKVERGTRTASVSKGFHTRLYIRHGESSLKNPKAADQCKEGSRSKLSVHEQCGSFGVVVPIAMRRW